MAKNERPDEFCDDGVTLKLNKSKSYGTVYADGFEETKFVQNGIGYRGDGTPVGYTPAAQRGLQVVTPPVEDVISENEALKRQIAVLMKRLEALEKPVDTTLHVAKKIGRPKKVEAATGV